MAYLVDDAVTGLIDIPADAVNAATGTGEDLGWFGAIDRGLDPRGIARTEEEAERLDLEGFQAAPTPENTGLSGFFKGTQGATSALAEEATSTVAGVGGGAIKGALSSPWVVLLLLAGAYLVLSDDAPIGG